MSLQTSHYSFMPVSADVESNLKTFFIEMMEDTLHLIKDTSRSLAFGSRMFRNVRRLLNNDLL